VRVHLDTRAKIDERQCTLRSDGARWSLTLPRGKIGKIPDVLFGDRLNYFAHGGIITRSRVVFIPAQHLQEVIVPLAGDAWNVLATREIGVVTDVAAVQVDRRSSTIDTRRINAFPPVAAAGSGVLQ